MSTGESFGRTIQLFLVDGKPTGLRKATIHGWTGLVFVSGIKNDRDGFEFPDGTGDLRVGGARLMEPLPPDRLRDRPLHENPLMRRPFRRHPVAHRIPSRSLSLTLLAGVSGVKRERARKSRR